MNGPSRSMIMRELHKSSQNQLTCGEHKVIETFGISGNPKVLVIRSDQVSLDFIKQFCSEHNLELKKINGYYYLS